MNRWREEKKKGPPRKGKGPTPKPRVILNIVRDRTYCLERGLCKEWGGGVGGVWGAGGGGGGVGKGEKAPKRTKLKGRQFC